MKKDKKLEETEESIQATSEQPEIAQNTQEEVSEIDSLKSQLEQVNNSYLLLLADFDNYKKKTLKEKSDLLKYGGENVLSNLLPIIDDFERAMQSLEKNQILL